MPNPSCTYQKHGYGLHSYLCLASHVSFETLVMAYVHVETTYVVATLALGS